MFFFLLNSSITNFFWNNFNIPMNIILLECPSTHSPIPAESAPVCDDIHTENDDNITMFKVTKIKEKSGHYLGGKQFVFNLRESILLMMKNRCQYNIFHIKFPILHRPFFYFPCTPFYSARRRELQVVAYRF